MEAQGDTHRQVHPGHRLAGEVLTGQQHQKTSLTYEYPSADGDPYYPVPRPENAELYRKYQTLADATPDVHFVGRLATYRYYNMDQVVGQALALYAKLAKTMNGKLAEPARSGLPRDATSAPPGVAA